MLARVVRLALPKGLVRCTVAGSMRNYAWDAVMEAEGVDDAGTLG